MPWTVTTTPPSWNVTDLELLKRLSYMLLENGNADATGTTTLTSMFTITQMLDALDNRQQQFMRDTGAVMAIATQSSTPGVSRYALPSDWIFTKALTWQAFGGQIKSLARVDSFQLDHGMPDWEQNTDLPSTYNDGSNLPTLTVEIAKTPAQIGGMELDYIAQPVALTGLGQKLTLPDECESAILWGALADLLGTEGEAYDPERAAHCEIRYQLTVQLTKALLEGTQ